ncbi:MAG: hypothetical protein ACI92W_002203 [Paraglaciecola sp.]|jgi:hypothetical protein
MRFLKKLLCLLCLGVISTFWSCKQDDPSPSANVFGTDQQFQIFLAADGIQSSRLALNDSLNLYYQLIDARPDSQTININDVIYFHFSLSRIQVSIDTVSLDTMILRTVSIPFDLTAPSLVAKVGADAIYPVGLDLGLVNSSIRVGEQMNYYLPPSVGFGDLQLGNLPAKSLLQIGIILDSVKTELDVLNQAQLDINRYIIDAELRDTTMVPGGPVVEILDINGGAVYFKRLGDSTIFDLPVVGDQVSLRFEYRYVTDSLLDAQVRSFFSVDQYANQDYVAILGSNELINGMSTGIRSMRRQERGLLLIPPQLAYREAVCFVPDLRTYQGSFWTQTTKTALIEGFVVPEYAFQVEPYRSLAVEVTLVNFN